MKESVVTFGNAGTRVGVLTEPKTLNNGPAVVFLNSGIVHHVGPNRIYVETARRLAWLLTRPGSGGEGIVAALTEGTDGSSVVSSPRSAGSGDAAVGDSTPCPPSGPPSSPPSRANGAADAAESTPPSPLSDRGAMASTEDPHFPDILKSGDPLSEKFFPETPALKTEPEVGGKAFLGEYQIEVAPPSREGLPPLYLIRTLYGKLLSQSHGGGWEGAVRWIRKQSGGELDMSTLEIVRPVRDEFHPVRSDQRQFATGGPDIAVLRGHETERKL